MSSIDKHDDRYLIHRISEECFLFLSKSHFRSSIEQLLKILLFILLNFVIPNCVTKSSVSSIYSSLVFVKLQAKSLDQELTLVYHGHNNNKNNNKKNPLPKSTRKGRATRLKFDTQTTHGLLAELNYDIGGFYQKFLRQSHIQSQTSNTDLSTILPLSFTYLRSILGMVKGKNGV